jgi:DNA (cytosine-5)-methyltransferase 1
MLELDPQLGKALKNCRYIDLFAGIGGFHLAMDSLGAQCVFASEWDKHAAQVYEQNFGLKPYGDITQVPVETIPEHDVLCAGFPCQAFSISGKQKGFDDTRGTLFFDVARIAKHHKPKLLFLENVKNFASHDQGNTLKVVRSVLEELGYQVFYKVLNAADYGLPQHRERVFIIGIRADLNYSAFTFPEPFSHAPSIGDILEPAAQTQSYEIHRSDVQLREARLSPELIRQARKPHRIGIVNKGGQGERIYHTEGLAITLSAYGGGIGAKTGLYWVQGVLRKLSPRECARAQGFPDSFQIHERTQQAWKQFGNSVPVHTLQALLIQICKNKVLD